MNLNFKRQDGEYVNETGDVRIVKESPRRWTVYVRKELWGEWEYRNKWGQGVNYQPFPTLTDALICLEASDIKGFLDAS